MGKTNAIISIYRNAVDANNHTTSTLIDHYAVWLEHTLAAVHAGQGISVPAALLERAQGFCILETNLNLASCYIVHNNTRYEIIKWTVFYKPYRQKPDARSLALGILPDFHHIEFVYG